MDFADEIKFLNGERLDALLLFYVKTSQKEVSTKYINLTDDAIEVMRKTYLNKIEELNKQGKNFDEFDPEEYDHNAILYLGMSKIQEDGLKLKELNGKDTMSIQDEFDIFKQEEINKIKYILIRFRNEEGKTLGVFSKYNFKNFFKPDKSLKFLFKGNSLKPLGVKHEFGLDTYMELLFFGEKVYIFKRNRFIEAFNYIDAFKKEEKEIFSYLRDNKNKDYTIKDIDALQAAVEKKYKYNYLTKLNNIYIRKYYKNIKFEKIEEVKKNHKLKMEIDVDKKEITFTDPEEFVRLYNKDYVHDDLDGEGFTSFRKKKS